LLFDTQIGSIKHPTTFCYICACTNEGLERVQYKKKLAIALAYFELIIKEKDHWDNKIIKMRNLVITILFEKVAILIEG